MISAPTVARSRLITELRAFGVLHLHYMRNSRTRYVPRSGGDAREYRQWVCKSAEHQSRECGTKACLKLRVTI